MALSLMSKGGGGLSGKLKVFNRTGGEGGGYKISPPPLSTLTLLGSKLILISSLNDMLS